MSQQPVKQLTSYILYQNEKIIVTTRYNDILHCAIQIESYAAAEMEERKTKKNVARTTETDCA